ncbi:MAG TPA: carbohydrate kinase family protein [Anaerolineaceae bacterium]
MDTPPIPRYVFIGELKRDFIITPKGASFADVPGGSALYAAAGAAIWDSGTCLVARVGEDYPQAWLEQIDKAGIDIRGVHILHEMVDSRYFVAHSAIDTRSLENPVSHYSRLGLPFPKPLLGYTPPAPQVDSRVKAGPLTIHSADIPQEYLDATAAHLCPLDFLSHSLLPPALRRGHISTVTVDAGSGYMNPVFWDDLPVLLHGITAFLTTEEQLLNLYGGRVIDPWEMAEGLTAFGCEIIIIRRGFQSQLVYEHGSHNRWIVPGYPSQVVDPTGTGNAFCGGFLAGFRATYDPLQATLYGNISSAMISEGSTPFYALDAMPGLATARKEALRSIVRRI